MELAVVIVSYNVAGLLAECLESLAGSLARSPALHASVWVIDNASADDSVRLVRERFPTVHLLASPDNLGYSAANNLVLQQVGFAPTHGEARPLAEYRWAAQLPAVARPPDAVWLLNPDTVVQGDAPAALVRCLEEAPRTAACGAQLAYPDGRFQHGAFRFPGLAQTALDFFPPPGRLNEPVLASRLNGRYPLSRYRGNQPFAVDFVLGATLLVRGEAMRQVGLLDEAYFMYCEEMDWQRRMQQAGWEVRCAPAARVVHVGGASSSQFRSRSFIALWQSRLRYFRRYHGPLFNAAMARLLRAGLAAEARRAQRDNAPDLADRLAAYRAVGELTQRETP